MTRLNYFGMVVLAYVLTRFIRLRSVIDWTGALHPWLWLGFPVILLAGSLMWQNVRWTLAAMHAGDWFIKLLVA